MSTDDVLADAHERLAYCSKLWERVGATVLVSEYDRWTKSYDKDMDIVQWSCPTYTVDAVKKHAPDKTSKILDVCGGTGRVGKELHSAGYNSLTYLDGSKGMLKEAMEKNHYQNYLSLVVEENEPTLIKEDFYDVTIMCAGHISNAKVEELLRVTKTGGIVIVTIVEVIVSESRDAGNALVLLQHLEDMKRCKLVEHVQIDKIRLMKDGSPAAGHLIVVQKI